MIINPPTYKINIINEIHDVLLIKFIISVKEMDWLKIIRFELNGDFIKVNIIDNIKLIKIIILVIIQYIF